MFSNTSDDRCQFPGNLYSTIWSFSNAEGFDTHTSSWGWSDHRTFCGWEETVEAMTTSYTNVITYVERFVVELTGKSQPLIKTEEFLFPVKLIMTNYIDLEYAELEVSQNDLGFNFIILSKTFNSTSRMQTLVIETTGTFPHFLISPTIDTDTPSKFDVLDVEENVEERYYNSKYYFQQFTIDLKLESSTCDPESKLIMVANATCEDLGDPNCLVENATQITFTITIESEELCELVVWDNKIESGKVLTFKDYLRTVPSTEFVAGEYVYFTTEVTDSNNILESTYIENVFFETNDTMLYENPTITSEGDACDFRIDDIAGDLFNGFRFQLTDGLVDMKISDSPMYFNITARIMFIFRSRRRDLEETTEFQASIPIFVFPPEDVVDDVDDDIGEEDGSPTEEYTIPISTLIAIVVSMAFCFYCTWCLFTFCCLSAICGIIGVGFLKKNKKKREEDEKTRRKVIFDENEATSSSEDKDDNNSSNEVKLDEVELEVEEEEEEPKKTVFFRKDEPEKEPKKTVLFKKEKDE